MAAYLVTGNPGSGKSTVAEELARRGLSTIDPDHDQQLSHWEDATGTWVDHPPTADEEWLRTHRWVWSRSRMEELLAVQDGPVFVCGIARNQDELLDLFDRVLLLQIDEATQEARLRAHDASRPPGRTEAGREEIRVGRALFQEQMLGLGAVPLDGGASPGVVTDRVLALVGLG